MKAIVYEKYGPPEVLRLTELPKPTPRDNEVLIKVRATTVSSGDWRVRSLEVPRGFGLLAHLALGIRGPRQKILGSELAGVVESTGSKVTRFKPGDEVFAFPGVRMGAYVEYKCMPEDGAIALHQSSTSRWAEQEPWRLAQARPHRGPGYRTEEGQCRRDSGGVICVQGASVSR